MQHSTDDHAPDARPDELSPQLDHVTFPNNDGPDELALFPRDGSETARMTTWILAQEHVFVDLESFR